MPWRHALDLPRRPNRRREPYRPEVRRPRRCLRSPSHAPLPPDRRSRRRGGSGSRNRPTADRGPRRARRRPRRPGQWHPAAGGRGARGRGPGSRAHEPRPVAARGQLHVPRPRPLRAGCRTPCRRRRVVRRRRHRDPRQPRRPAPGSSAAGERWTPRDRGDLRRQLRQPAPGGRSRRPGRRVRSARSSSAHRAGRRRRPRGGGIRPELRARRRERDRALRRFERRPGAGAEPGRPGIAHRCGDRDAGVIGRGPDRGPFPTGYTLALSTARTGAVPRCPP